MAAPAQPVAGAPDFAIFDASVSSAAIAAMESDGLSRIIHDSFCCKLAFLAPRVFRPRCSLRRTASASRCAAPGASAIRFGNRAFATKSRE
jgi:hypothetical protein